MTGFEITIGIAIFLTGSYLIGMIISKLSNLFFG